MKVHRSILVLEDGSTYYGWSFIPSFTTTGEVVFNTGMTGYQEVITDPSYSDQIINFTYPELGNTGINHTDIESQVPLLKGVIAKNICSKPSNWRKSMSLVDYLTKLNIMHIYGIDTRSITRHLRKLGTMNGTISSNILEPSLLVDKNTSIIDMKKTDLVLNASTLEPYTITSYPRYQPFYSNYKDQVYFSKANLHIVVLDFGIKSNILRYLDRYITKITVVPADTSYNNIVSYTPDGILLSNGPGNPQCLDYAVQTVQSLINNSNIPIFGICMGHQIISIALGLNAFKLGFGHRGLNHPVGHNKRINITSQNHGFAIEKDNKKQKLVMYRDFNYNDDTVASIIHRERPYFAVQYHPEASPGPHDADSLFLHFIRVTKKIKEYAKII